MRGVRRENYMSEEFTQKSSTVNKILTCGICVVWSRELAASLAGWLVLFGGGTSIKQNHRGYSSERGV